MTTVAHSRPQPRRPEQAVYPSVLRFCVGHDPRTHQLTWSQADAIPAAVVPDLDRDLGACCWLSGRPRYAVDGIERPDFDPTVPDDLADAGWCWRGGFLTQAARTPEGCHLAIGPRPTLDAIWESARAAVAEQHAAEERKATRAANPTKKPKIPKTPPRHGVVVVGKAAPPPPPQPEPNPVAPRGQPNEPLHQLAMF